MDRLRYAGRVEHVGDRFRLETGGALRRAVLKTTRGRKLVYITDVVFSDDNRRRIVEFAADADILFIEAPFLHEDAIDAAWKYHLTARQAGTLARLPRARRVEPMHFPPRHLGSEHELRAEVESAFRGDQDSDSLR